jgi:hypothetical protein
MAEHYRASFDNFLKDIRLAATPPGQSAWISNSAVFSKRIYLYHDDFISQDDLATFRLLFSHNGADVEFRGPAYIGPKQNSRLA